MSNKSEKKISRDPFLDSLHALEPSQIDSKLPKKRVGSYIAPLLRWGALVLCAVVLAGSLLSIAASIADYQTADDYYDGLADLWEQGGDEGNPFGEGLLAAKNYAGSPTPDFENAAIAPDIGGAPVDTSADTEMMLQIRAKLGALKAQNSDLLGWITIPNTRIDYPVVHTTDNEYYLNHSFEKAFLRAGAIFVDYRNMKDLSKNYNTVIYGHNMLSGAMFSCISDFFGRNYFNNNRYIYIYTENGIYVYQTFAVRKIRVDKDTSYITTYFETAEDFVAFCNKMKSASSVKVNDVTFGPEDKIITLSTCTNSHNDNERYCLQAKLVRIEK